MIKPVKPPKSTPLVIGHRGAPGYAPEHTRKSYALALGFGVDIVEPDLVPTSDGRLLCRHGNTLSDTTDIAEHASFRHRRRTARIDGKRLTDWFAEDFSWEELSSLTARERPNSVRNHLHGPSSEHLIDLDEVIQQVAEHNRTSGTNVGICLEFKHASFFDARGYRFDDLLSDSLARTRESSQSLEIHIESDDPTFLRRARDLAQGRVVQLILNAEYRWDERQGRNVERFADMVTEDGMKQIRTYADTLALPKKRIGLEQRTATSGRRPVELAAGIGLDVFAWTFRSENAYLPREFRTGGADAFGDFHAEYVRYFDEGVAAVFSDHPDHAIAARNAWQA